MNDVDAAKTRKVTIRHVAEDAGVSTAAVSKVLRNAYGVSDSLRAKVLTSIEKLGYRPSTAARGMRGRTYSVGLLLVDIRNSFLSSLVEGVIDRLGQANYRTLIGVSEAKAALESSLIDSMLDLRMDGVILVAPRLPSDVLAAYSAQAPLIVVGHHEPETNAFDTVNSDDETGARIAVEALISKGHKRIHMTSLPPPKAGQHDVFYARERGYLSAMQTAGLSEHTKILRVPERDERLDEYELLGQVLEGDVPDAFFCWSDIHAVPLLNAAKMRGIDVPGQLAIVGYDDTPIASLPLISLSSVDQHGAEIGRTAADLILSRIGERRTAEHVLIPPSFTQRDSS